MTLAEYTEAEHAAALEYLRGRRSLRAAWKVENHLRSEQQTIEVRGLISLSRVMMILRQVLLQETATPRRVQNTAWCGKTEGRGAAEFIKAGPANDSSNVASIR